MAAGGMIVIGSSRSGKTTAINTVEERLTQNGFRVQRFDDKDYLMAEAITDMKGFDLYHGPIETQKTRVLNPEVALTKPRKLQLVFKDGRLLNDAHTKIMYDIGQALFCDDPRLVVLADLAYGTDVNFGEGKEPLVQSGKQFVRWFAENGILFRRDTLIREITAPFDVRAERNEKSEERIETKEFKILFPDFKGGVRGFLPEDRMTLGDKLRHIDNGTIPEEKYMRIIHRDFENNFLCRIRGEGQFIARERGLGKL